MGSRRQKTSIACVNCSRSHVTCEDKRPCSRCVRKGLEATCVDAPRKRRKYLADVPEEHLPVPVKRSDVHSGEEQDFNGNGRIQHKPKFLSSAADLEYSILSNIIHQDTYMNKVPIDLLYSRTSTEDGSQYATPSNTPSVTPTQANNSLVNQRPTYKTLLGPQGAEAIEYKVNLFTNHYPLIPQDPSSENIDPDNMLSSAIFDKGLCQYYLTEGNTLPKVFKTIRHTSGVVSLALDTTSPESRAIQNFPEVAHTLRYQTPLEIYTLVSTAFSHTPGFHSLLGYLRERFNKKDLVEMCRSLAEFRPTFIAIAVTLTEEDMIFMEQCYQRTLLEYDQFISQIGTPTCVWRRNGQVSYINDEFTLLTGWAREDLLFKMTFIVELMDDESVRDYFKTFSRVAYRDFKGCERMKTCRLLTPIKGREINCCCMWTLKRDVFGLPLMIIGNFMPVLQSYTP